MSMRIAVAAAVLSTTVAEAQVQESWHAQADVVGLTDTPVALLRAADGGLVVVGESLIGFTQFDINTDTAVIKYSTDGTEQWRQVFGSIWALKDTPYAAAVDQDGNIYVAGASVILEQDQKKSVSFLVKYSPSGTPLWDVEYSNSQYNLFTALGIGPDGFPVGAGQAGNQASMVKFAPTDGAVVWERTVSQPSGVVYGFGYLAIDPDGAIIGAGESVATKFSPAGEQLWQREYNGYYSGARAIALDGRDIYIAGTEYGWGNDFFVVKYAPDGSQLWHTLYGAQTGVPVDDFLTGLGLDGAGNVYLSGPVTLWPGQGEPAQVFGVVSFTPKGTQRWDAQFSPPGVQHCFPETMAVSADGSAYLTGWTNTGSPEPDLLTVRFDAPGSVAWHIRTDGPAGLRDEGQHILAGPGGAVTVLGRTFAGQSTYDDYFLVQYQEATCAADFNGDGVLDVDDFIAFQTAFGTGDARADCDGSSELDMDDFVCFQTLFGMGCP